MKYAVIGGKLHYSTDGEDWAYKECPFAPMDRNDTIRPCGIKCALFDTMLEGESSFLPCHNYAILTCVNRHYPLTDITKKD